MDSSISQMDLVVENERWSALYYKSLYANIGALLYHIILVMNETFNFD